MKNLEQKQKFLDQIKIAYKNLQELYSEEGVNLDEIFKKLEVKNVEHFIMVLEIYHSAGGCKQNS